MDMICFNNGGLSNDVCCLPVHEVRYHLLIILLDA